MPGIVGIVTHVLGEKAANVVDRMVQPLTRRRSQKVCIREFSQAALASISLEEGKLATDQGKTLALAGDIVGLDDLWQRAVSDGEVGPSFTTDAERLLALYQRNNQRALCGLNGLYAIAIWEEEPARLTLINDRYGIRKLYYWVSQVGLMFASEIKSISWHPHFNREISPLAVADLLSVGYLLDDRTLFEEIHILPPASILTYEDGRVNISQYWDYSFDSHRVDGLHEDDLIDGMYVRLDNAIKARVANNTAILITGGLDSRLIATIAYHHAGGGRIETNTIGTETSADVNIGRQVSQAIGMPHTWIPIGSDSIARYAGLATWITEGNTICDSSWIFAEVPYLDKNGYQAAMTGNGAEAISGRHWWVTMLETNPARALANLYSRDQFDLSATFLRPEYRPLVRQESFHSFEKCLSKAKTGHILNQLDYAILYQDNRRQATSIDVLGDQVSVQDAFLDNELIDFSLSIPPELRARGYLYKKMVQRYLPDVAAIGHQSVTVNIKPGLLLKYEPVVKQFERVMGRVEREWKKRMKTPDGDSPTRNIQPNLWLRTGSKAVVTDVVDHPEYYEDILDVSNVHRFLVDFLEGRNNSFRKVCALVTLVQWRRFFCAQEPLSDYMQDLPV